MAAFLSVYVALALGQGAYEFLGTQGDPWDTQSDIFFGLIGVEVAVTLMRRKRLN